MVLSNKKLKQKLRAAKVETLIAGESEHNAKKPSKTNTDSNSELQELLEAAKQRSRLSKREKRRKTQSLQGIGSSQSNVDGEISKETEKVEGKEGKEGDEKRKKKKRKRESEEKDAVVKQAKKVKKMSKKKRNKKKGKNGSVEFGGAVEEAPNGNGESQVMEDFALKVYVGGIPYYSNEDDIRSYFESCGTITEIDCMKFPDSGKFRGIAIISFKIGRELLIMSFLVLYSQYEDEECQISPPRILALGRRNSLLVSDHRQTEAAAKRALALHGADMGGFFLKIQPYKTTKANKVPNFAPQIIEGYNRIYVGNLSWDITEDDIKKFFSDCSISSIRFGMDKDTEEFKGYAHVDFSDNLSLTMALKLDQQILCGRPVKLSCAVPLKKGGKIQAGNVPHKKEAEIQATNGPTTNETNGQGTTSSTGKMKRRTCYECGEKGHISTACPKKQNADPANADTS